eukprot:403334319
MSIYQTFYTPNSNFRLFGVDRHKEKQERDYAQLMKHLHQSQNPDSNPVEIYYKDKCEKEISEFLELEKIMKNTVKEDALKHLKVRKAQTKKNNGQQMYNFIGLSRKELRDMSSQSVMSNIKREQIRLNVKYSIPLEEQDIQKQKPESKNNSHFKKAQLSKNFSQKQIDLSSYFNAKDHKVNVNYPFYQFYYQQNFSPKTVTNQINVEDQNSGLKGRNSLNQNKQFVFSQSMLNTLTLPGDGRVTFLKPSEKDSNSNYIRKPSALGTPRSATLKKYDMYKQHVEDSQFQSQDSSNNLVVGSPGNQKKSGFAAARRTSIGKGNARDTVQLIHDVVDSIKRNKDILQTSPNDEGNNIELEHDLSQGLKDMRQNKMEVSNKIHKKFKNKTIQTFNAKKFDIEKAELKQKK